MLDCDIRHVFTFPLKEVLCSTKNAYTSEIIFLTLVPWFIPLITKKFGIFIIIIKKKVVIIQVYVILFEESERFRDADSHLKHGNN